MTIHSLSATSAIRTRAARGATWFGWMRTLFQAVESRRHLAEMDARMLSDIGISRAEALHEAARAPWDLAPPR